MFYLMMHSTYLLYGYGVRHRPMLKDHSDNEIEFLLPIMGYSV